MTGYDSKRAAAADKVHGYDWSMLEAAQDSLREHMARIKELEAQLAQPAQEPVAIIIRAKLGNVYSFTGNYSLREGDKVYITPPKRPWVGLTDEDIYDCFSNDPKVAMRNVEQVLQEKNT